MKLPELITQNQEVKTILQTLDNQLKNSCQKAGCPNSCRQIPTLPKQVLTQLKIMEDQDEWEEEVNDPDFTWTDYKQELQEQLIELGEKYPVYQKPLKDFAWKLDKVESEGEWEEIDDKVVNQKQLDDYYDEELLRPESNLIPKLLTNEIVISATPIIPFCQGCYNSPKPIPTVQQTQQFLGSILPTINQQLPNQEKLNSTFLVHQDKPASWNNVREVWIDPEYKGGSFACRFCVLDRLHPSYRKFYLFDNRCFYLDQGWKKMVKRFYPKVFKD